MTEQTFILESLRETAQRAYYNLSHDPERRGASVIRDHSIELQGDLDTMPEEDKEANRARYIHHLTTCLYALGRTASPMIVGPAKFNYDRMEKLNRAYENKFKAFIAWRTAALKAIECKADQDKSPQQKREEQWRKWEKSITEMCVQVIQGKGTTISRRQYRNAIAKTVTQFANDGDADFFAAALVIIRAFNAQDAIPIIASDHPVWSMTPVQKQEPEVKENKETEINGIRIIHNYELDRIQIIFRDRAHANPFINKIKSHAWRWSPTHKAWQRKLTNAAIYEAGQLAGQSPSPVS